MKLISRSDAAGRSLRDLQGLLRDAFQTLATADADSPEHSAAQTSIRHIQDELAFRKLGL